MKLDLLTILLPKSLDMGSIGSGKSHDSITPQEVSTILAYANLVKTELNILMGKYLEDESATRELIKYVESRIEIEDKKLVKKYQNVDLIYSANTITHIKNLDQVFKSILLIF